MTRSFIGHQPFKGRGAASNPAVRFEATTREQIHDGWYEDEIVEHLSETVLPDRARSVITSNKSPDVGFDQSINPYRGCSHGCVYCFARPTHAYLGLSPGLDFETKLFYKADAVKILEAELAKPKYVCKPIALGINTDGYQPLEKRLDITRTLEPRAASPQARLRVVEQLARAGIPVGVLIAPVIPAITDHEMEDILAAAKEAGAGSAGYVLLRLPHEVKILFREWLAEHDRDRAKHVISLINQTQGGKDYDAEFGRRMTGTGPYAELLRTRFELALRKCGFDSARDRHELEVSLFRPPTPDQSQLTLGF